MSVWEVPAGLAIFLLVVAWWLGVFTACMFGMWWDSRDQKRRVGKHRKPLNDGRWYVRIEWRPHHWRIDRYDAPSGILRVRWLGFIELTRWERRREAS